MEQLPLPLKHRILRRIVRLGLAKGATGYLGRIFGRHLGWPLPGGARIPIEDPAEYIQRQIITHGVYEPNVAFVIGNLMRQDSVFVDVGANIGQHTLIAASTGARVLALEPLPRLAQRLRDSIRLNRFEDRVTIIQLAAGNASSEAILYVARRGDDGSHSLLAGVAAEKIEQIAVKVTTLDDLLAGQAVSADLIKIDVEGFESVVLDGASLTLGAARPPVWIVETGDRLANQLGESADTLIHRFRAAGYEIWELPEFSSPRKITNRIDGQLTNYLTAHPRSVAYERTLNLLQKMRAP